MYIQALRQHFPARKSEWFATGMIFTWGADLLLHPSMFTKPYFSGFVSLVEWTDYPPAALWGLLALIAGMVGGFALFVNGTFGPSPTLRASMAGVRALVWALIVLGIMRNGLANLGIAIYPWLIVIDFFAAKTAAQDAVISARNAKIREYGGGAIPGRA